MGSAPPDVVVYSRKTGLQFVAIGGGLLVGAGAAFSFLVDMDDRGPRGLALSFLLAALGLGLVIRGAQHVYAAKS